MKKFVFKLATLNRVKERLKKNQTKMLAEAVKNLEEFMRQLREVEYNIESLSNNIRNNMGSEGINLQTFRDFSNYFQYLTQLKKELLENIKIADEYRFKCQKALEKTVLELKTYEKLYDKQYERYLLEVSREEEKVLGDIISFKSISQKAAEIS